MQPEDREQFILNNQWALKHGPAVPEEEEGNWSINDEMFVFRKVITDKND